MNEAFAARVAEAYDNHADRYATVLEPMLKPAVLEMVTMGSVTSGDRVLDLATGTGIVARAVAQSGASVVGVDFSPGILRRARELAIIAISYAAADAHELPFQDGRFDLVTCGFSLSHFSNVAKALVEVVRVLRPGGRFISSAWGTEGSSPSKEAAVEVRRRFLEERELTFEGRFNEETWADPRRGRETLQVAGFADIRVSSRTIRGEHPNSAAAVEAALAWPLTRYRIAALDPQAQQQLFRETAAAIRAVTDLSWATQWHLYVAARP